MSLTDVDLSTAVSGVIGRSLERPLAPGEIPDDAPLAELGLDSMRSINLLLELESVFGIVFPDEALTPENFATAASIRRLVDSLRRGTGA